MTLKMYLWGICGGTVLSLVALGMVVSNVDPESAGIAGQAMLYLSAFLFFAGIFVLIFTWSRLKWNTEEGSMPLILAVSFRQGVLLAILCVVLLLLQSFRVLTWWDGVLVLAGILLIELYFLARN